MKPVSTRLVYLYPFLFALYPVLALLGQNIGQVTPITILRPLLFSLAFCLVIYLLAALLLRNLGKAALLTLIIEVIFFSYGHEARLIGGIPGIGPTLGSDRYLGAIDLLLLAAAAVWIVRTKSSLSAVTSFLGIACVFMIALPMVQIVEFYRITRGSATVTKSMVQTGSVQTQMEKPDIYFIILDAYSRQDLLKADFGFDNQPFISQLTDLGFQVIPCSRSNYNATSLSLSSMLNMKFETSLGVLASSVSSGQNPMVPLIKNNEVRTILEQMGYSIYTFESGFPDLDWPDTHQFTLPTQESWVSKQLLPIESIYIKNSALSILLDSNIGVFKQIKTSVESPNAEHIALVENIINKLPGTASLPGPKFVYAHLILPHKPFVFDAQGNIRTDTNFFSKNGDAVNDTYYREGYIGQVEFANQVMIQDMKDLLRYSQKPPIIILMGDHGYQATDTHFENLMAIYMPGPNAKPFYSTITNINVFRSILNDYFDASYPMLPDLSYRIDFDKGVYLPAPEIQPDCLK